MYHFTVDEIVMEGENLFLIESKHSKSGKLPSVGDIKDGLLKMMLYCNLENVSIDNQPLKSLPVLRLTSEKIIGEIASRENDDAQAKFFSANNFSGKQKDFTQNLFAEAETNNFAVSLGGI